MIPSNIGPSDEQARAFAVMLSAGLPAEQAILYFTDTQDPAQVSEMLRVWTRSRKVQAAQALLMGKSWQEMSLEERIKYALDQHYSALAYLLYSTNYNSVGPQDKAKLDTARVALEQKLAGTAGKGDALSQFFEDFRAGKLKLQQPLSPKVN